MVLDHREHYLAPIRTALVAFITPIQYLVDAPFKVTAILSTNLANRRTLLTENEKLHSENLQLKAKLQKFTALESENIELRSLLKSLPKLRNERTAIAQLLAISTNPLVSEFVLDKGSRDGIYEGQPVLDANGILGQIMQTSLWTSRVLLITDLRSAVPVQVTRNGIRGIVIGKGNLAKLALTNIPETVDVRVGDTLVTSGLGGYYPVGYPVGVISSVQHGSGEQFTKITVTPIANLDRARNVLLLWVSHGNNEAVKPATKTATKSAGGKKS